MAVMQTRKNTLARCVFLALIGRPPSPCRYPRKIRRLLDIINGGERDVWRALGRVRLAKDPDPVKGVVSRLLDDSQTPTHRLPDAQHNRVANRGEALGE